ncbi:MAG: hypothetical protein HZC28_18885 [Spirochaetes bacterium]|nr:hypothetical protein [Spirochaetota bacterium]
MDRSYYINLAREGVSMPIGTHLTLHEYPDPNAVLHNGAMLGKVMEETARRYGTPIAVPVMDLTIEKEAMLKKLGVAAGDIPTFHFSSPPEADAAAALLDDAMLAVPRFKALLDALTYVSSKTDLLPVGMCIGPFSLTTKLLADPIIPIFLAGDGMTAADSDEVKLIERVALLARTIIERSIALQCKAGAKAVFLCEPAANLVFFSPNQMHGKDDVFQRYVIEPNMKLRAILESYGADLFFHDCGELTTAMVERFAQLDPAVLSLGSPVKLWDMEPFVPKQTVLFGNLPSKKFFSDKEITVDQVRALADELSMKMSATGHPFILASECDVLSVPGCDEVIHSKIEAFCGCGMHAAHKTA